MDMGIKCIEQLLFHEVGTLQSTYWIEIRTVPPVKLPFVAVITIEVAE
jgi:hypothetical protein